MLGDFNVRSDSRLNEGGTGGGHLGMRRPLISSQAMRPQQHLLSEEGQSQIEVQ